MVRRAVSAAGDDAEHVVVEAHDGEVGLEPSARAEHRRVDDPADRHVHLPHCHPLHGVERPGPEDVEDRERGEIDHPRAVTHGQVLGVDDRRPPAGIPLGLAAVDAVAVLLEQRCVRLVPVRALPPGGLEEDRVQLLLARVEGGQPHLAVRGPLLRRVDDPVGLVEALAGAGADVRARLLVVPEPRDVGGVQIDLRLAVHHPLRDRLGDAGALLDPHGRARPQPSHLVRLAQQRHPVRGQREQAVDRVLHAHALVAHDLRHQLERILHLLVEVGLGERQLGGREGRLLDRGDLLRVVQDRPVRVGADLEADAVLALVHERVHVAHDRELDVPRRLLEARHRADVDHLVDRRRERDRCARHAGQRRAPDAAGDDDGLGLDVASRCAHPPDAAVLDVDPEHLGVRKRGRLASLHRPLAHDRAGPQRVHHADAGGEEAADEDRFVDERHKLLDLRRRDQRDVVDAPGVRR